MGGAPAIYDDSRATWGAAKNTNPIYVAPSARLGISWHYPGGSLSITPASSHASCLSQVKAWQTFHMQSNGWADIGYNLLICQHARVIEGRGVDLKGAHSPGVNYEHYGVQFMVSGTNAPTAAMYARAVTLRAALEAHSGHKLREWGHKDDPAASTECPGAVIESWVKSGGPYAATATATPQEDDMQLSDTVHLFTGRGVDYDSATTNVEGVLASTNLTAMQARNAIYAQAAQISALAAAVQALSTAQGVDGAQVQATIKDAVDKALAGLSVTLTTPPAA